MMVGCKGARVVRPKRPITPNGDIMVCFVMKAGVIKNLACLEHSNLLKGMWGYNSLLG